MIAGIQRIHFVGIGGIGMSSIASILQQRGYQISGSDIKENRLTARIREKGGKISIGHCGGN
ncbi:MAG: Mur ligase domain-containing protein, partial [Candidatus Omnitrophota bacterium]